MHKTFLFLSLASTLSKTNSREKNHVESRSIASAIYHRSLAIISHQGCNFFGELEVNLTSLVSFPCRTLAQVIANTGELLMMFW
jgi:hypothetical protein